MANSPKYFARLGPAETFVCRKESNQKQIAIDPYKGPGVQGILQLPCTFLRKLLEDVLNKEKGRGLMKQAPTQRRGGGGPGLTDGGQAQGAISPDCSRRTKDSRVGVLEKKKRRIDNLVYLNIQKRDFYSSVRGFRVQLVIGTWKTKREKQLLTPGPTKSCTRKEWNSLRLWLNCKSYLLMHHGTTLRGRGRANI